MEYTKGKWRVGEARSVFAGERLVANCGGFTMSGREHEALVENEANADRIVKAVNCHDELVEALKTVVTLLSPHTCKFHGPMVCDKCHAIETARKALAKAEAL